MNDILTGLEHISFSGMPTGYLLRDFWAWSSSDLLNNTLRGALGEFIVSIALGLDIKASRQDWEPWDLTYPIPGQKHELHIEVKTSAYLQSWKQAGLSKIRFGIQPTHAWSEDTGYSGDMKRQSDLYVFCLFTCKDKDTADPLMLDDWKFYVLSTAILNERCGSQKSISLASLEALRPKSTDFDGIKDAILSVSNVTPPPPRHIA